MSRVFSGSLGKFLRTWGRAETSDAVLMEVRDQCSQDVAIVMNVAERGIAVVTKQATNLSCLVVVIDAQIALTALAFFWQ
jgi:hypothetical protein